MEATGGPGNGQDLQRVRVEQGNGSIGRSGDEGARVGREPELEDSGDGPGGLGPGTGGVLKPVDGAVGDVGPQGSRIASPGPELV